MKIEDALVEAAKIDSLIEALMLENNQMKARCNVMRKAMKIMLDAWNGDDSDIEQLARAMHVGKEAYAATGSS